MWRKAMHMLGLDDEVDYDEPQPGYGQEPDRGPSRDRPHTAAPTSSVSTVPSLSSPVPPADEPSGLGAVRPIRAKDPRDLGPGSVPSAGGHRPGHVGPASTRDQPPGSVRRVVKPVPMAANAKPHVVAPESFNQAQGVADAYKVNQPVIMDLQGADRELSRRLIDFASGLCYGLGGQMERLDSQVYLLTPTNVTVSSEERRRLRERGYDA